MATKSKIKRIGGRRCVAFGCSNKKADGCSLFSFPKDDYYKKLWISEVKKLRQDFDQPSPHSTLCSLHFSNEMFEPSCLLSNEFGIPKTMRLLTTAVPTIKKPDCKRSTTASKVRGAAAKRQRKQV